MRISIRLRSNVAAELRVIRRLEQEENQSAVIRAALIAHYEGAGLSNAGLSAKLDRVLRLLEGGVVAVPQSENTVIGDGFDELDSLGI